MNKQRIFYLLFLIISTVMLFAYKSKITSVLFLFAIIYPIISVLLAFITSKLLKAKIEFRSLYAEKQENFSVAVKLTNRFILPIAPAEIIGYFPYKRTNLFEYQNILISVLPFSTTNINFSAPIKLRGVYDCGIEKIVVHDFLKLFKFTKYFNKFEKVVILPRKHVINPIRDISSSDNETESTSSFSLDKNNFTNIREYINGDHVKHIHWKMSAKQDKLMVKQFERSVGGVSIIIADLNEYFPLDEENSEVSDCIIETLIALNMTLISEKQSCVNLWYSPVTKKCEQRLVKDEGDFALLYNSLSVLPRQNETFLPESIARSHGAIPSDTETVFFITSQLRNDFLSNINEIELFKNKKLRILLVESESFSDDQKKLVASIRSAAFTELWLIDRNDIVSSINYAIELNKKR